MEDGGRLLASGIMRYLLPGETLWFLPGQESLVLRALANRLEVRDLIAAARSLGFNLGQSHRREQGVLICRLCGTALRLREKGAEHPCEVA